MSKEQCLICGKKAFINTVGGFHAPLCTIHLKELWNAIEEYGYDETIRQFKSEWELCE